MLFEGIDPDDPPASEGDNVSVDGVAVISDGSLGFVGQCCEPVPGMTLAVNPPTVATFEESTSVFGHAPALSPDESMLVRPVYDQIVVSDLQFNEIASAPWDVAIGTLYEVIFVDNDTVVALAFGPFGVILNSYDVGAAVELTPVASATITSATTLNPTLAGSAAERVYVAGLTDAMLTAFDAATLQPAPADDIELPDEPLSAWVQDGELRWIDQSRVLHVGETTIPGSFVWVR